MKKLSIQLYVFFITLVISFGLLSTSASAKTLTVVGFNTESGDANPSFIAQNYIAPIDEVDIWGFSEVQNDLWALEFEEGAEAGESDNFERILGTTGGGDRLAIVYNNNRLELLDVTELDDINIRGRVRAPMVAHFRFRSNEKEFLFMVNHLYRGSASGRLEQAILLNTWASQQTLPIIAVGDYNFDWNISNETGNESFDAFVEPGTYQWIKPTNLINTICGFNSILDFTFTVNEASNWSGSSEVLYEANYCPDNNQRSDHRPVLARFTISEDDNSEQTAEQALEKVQTLETELAQLKQLIQKLLDD